MKVIDNLLIRGEWREEDPRNLTNTFLTTGEKPNQQRLKKRGPKPK